MILTWKQITNEVIKWVITIEPFEIFQINPNSYNYRLWSVLKKPKWIDWERVVFEEFIIPQDGCILEKWIMYLWHTFERIWSDKYMTSLIWRSSMWRLWMFLQLSANVWHTGTVHNWTLEIFPTQNIRVYPNMIIGQVTFWKNNGKINLYSWSYKEYNTPQESLIY